MTVIHDGNGGPDGERQVVHRRSRSPLTPKGLGGMKGCIQLLGRQSPPAPSNTNRSAVGKARHIMQHSLSRSLHIHLT
ncbi:hypothetical protein [Achromobacter denitrificans]|jgi:hypothetical protein|uniref:hypothetical protein n=1 Tax=Achromobacter denitrificans TaxID=32002 RepID=UPI00242C4C99|nr:hypothetical protein [Achromobacter denitrificans]MBV2161406.1 hypothetical protein [Achromobacter denitrificans]